eukprot:6036236-Pyramimonas_sp.AAC.1
MSDTLQDEPAADADLFSVEATWLDRGWVASGSQVGRWRVARGSRGGRGRVAGEDDNNSNNSSSNNNHHKT